MSKRTRDLTHEEKKLWRRVAESVKPRRKAEPDSTAAPADRRAHRTQIGPGAAAPTAAKSATSKSAASKSTGASAAPKPPPPADRAGEKRVRRGRIELAATLDLHGHNQITARAALVRFLVSAQGSGARAVAVVTGAGRDGRGVLKQRVPEWLAEPDLRPLVAGFARAHRSHGGAGAYYVFLKRA